MFFPEPLQGRVERHDGGVEFVKLGRGAQHLEKSDGAAGTHRKGRILVAGEQADFLSDQFRANSRDGVQDMGLNRGERMGAHRAAMALGNQCDERREEADDLRMKPVAGLQYCRSPGVATQEGVDRGMGHAARLANLEQFEHGASALSEA